MDASGRRCRTTDVFLSFFRLHRTFTANEDGPSNPSLSSLLVKTKSDPLTSTGANNPVLFSSSRIMKSMMLN